jgi:two-component system sensor histidine kinase QseC
VTRRLQPLQLELVLRNLIENALRHTPPGTQIEVAVWRSAQGAVGISISDDGGRAQPDQIAAAIPEGRAAGLGLGLRLVERLAEQMGADLERDRGESPMTTRFTLRWNP